MFKKDIEYIMSGMKKGVFITFEGADGCGKTTQVELAAKFLKESGLPYIKTREPGGSELGKELRQILLHYPGAVASECETFLYLADRAQHVETVIKPAIKAGKAVLCDRFIDSTIAYQGFGRGIDLERIKYLNNVATGGLRPDLTIVFDVDSAIAQTRLGGEKDRLEAEGFGFHKKVREGYLAIAAQEPERVKIVDANKGIEEVFEQTLTLLRTLLN